MTKHLLIASLVAIAPAGALTSYAETQAYFFDDLGYVQGVADNGKFAAIADDEDLHAYLWTAENPSELKSLDVVQDNTADLPSSQIMTGFSAMDVTNDGMVVGSIYYKNGKQKAAYWVDGEWHFLPLNEYVLNTTCALGVTPDGRVISGYQFINDPTSEIGGRYYPATWTLNDNGEYELDSHTDIELPAHQGFIPFALNPEGNIIAGMMYCGTGSTVPVLLVDGELRCWNEFDTRLEPFEYKGEVIGLFEEYYIDGYNDGIEGLYFNGCLMGCDNQGNFYGFRTRAFDVTEDGNGRLVNSAVIYNIKTDTWTDVENHSGYTCGFGDRVLFHNDGNVTIDDITTDVAGALDVNSDEEITGISTASMDGKVFGGVTQVVNPANQQLQFFPMMVVLDNGLNETDGVSDIVVTDSKVVMIATAGHIEVLNATDVAIYDLDGRQVATGASADVAPGIYVVKADNVSRKLFVK